jgi:hypothetical protein
MYEKNKERVPSKASVADGATFFHYSFNNLSFG